MRKWQSNSAEFMNKIAETEVSAKNECKRSNREEKADTIQEEDETYTKSTIGRANETNDAKTVKLLGVSWNCESNDLCFNISDLINFAKDLPITKRSLLKLTAKIFKPLGMLSPFVVKM